MTPSPMKRYRTALVGFGYWGPNLLRNLVFHGGFDMVGVADAKPDLREKCKRAYPHISVFASVEELLKNVKPEAVVIATPPSTHRELAVQCMKAGAHVLVEKPLALSTVDCDEILRTSEATGCKVMVDHTFIFHPAVNHLSGLIDRQEFGRLLYFDSVRVNLGGYQAATDVLWDLGPHDLSILDYFLRGEQPSVVTVMGASHYDPNHANLCYVHLGYDSGFVAHLHLNWTAPVKVRTIMLGGAKKMAVYDENLGSEKVRIYDRGLSVADLRASYRSGDMIAPALPQQEALAKMLAHFHGYLSGQMQPVSDGYFGRRVVEVLEAASASLRAGGMPVKVRSPKLKVAA